MNPSVPRTVVTGGAGFIGSAITRRLVQSGHAVLVVDDLSAGRREAVPDGAELLVIDLTDRHAIESVVEWRPSAVIHAAAQASVAQSWLDPITDAQANAVGTIAALEAATRAATPRFVYLTTGGALYGHTRVIPTPERVRISPVSPYGLSKWYGERSLNLLAPKQMRVCVLRLANVYGPGQRSDGEGGVVATFVERMRSHEPIEIHGDGRQTRDFVFVEDVVDATVLGLGSARSCVANIGTGIETSVLELYRRLARLLEYQLEPTYTAPRRGDVRRSALDATLARRCIGWAPKTDLSSGLRLVLGLAPVAT